MDISWDISNGKRIIEIGNLEEVRVVGIELLRKYVKLGLGKIN